MTSRCCKPSAQGKKLPRGREKTNHGTLRNSEGSKDQKSGRQWARML